LEQSTPLIALNVQQEHTQLELMQYRAMLVVLAKYLPMAHQNVLILVQQVKKRILQTKNVFNVNLALTHSEGQQPHAH